MESLLEQKNPLISVIMPVHNREEFLADAIESILYQTFHNFEFIIIIDGPSKKVIDLIHLYSKIDNRIKIISHEMTMGISHSRNVGLSTAMGEYIAVMDSDDISLPERFEKQISFLDSHLDIDIVGLQIKAIDPVGKTIYTSSYPLSPGMIRWGLCFGCPIAHPTAIMRSKIFKNSNVMYDETYITAQDFALWVKLSSKHKIANLSDILLLYRVHSNSSTKKYSNIQQKESYQIIRDEIKKLTGVQFLDDAIAGLKVSKKIKDHEDAKTISKTILKLWNTSKKWDITRAEKSEIRHLLAHKLRSIWLTRKMDIRLLPFVMYSLLIYPRNIIKPLYKVIQLIDNK